MKKFLSLLTTLAMIGVLCYFTSCKKCYHCHNDCTLCTKSVPYLDTIYTPDTLHHDTIVTIDTLHRIDSSIHCTDYYNTDADYKKAISNDTANSYKCVPVNPNYVSDYCVNNPGDNYTLYYNKGGRAKCDPK